jgi:hypothetical protein
VATKAEYSIGTNAAVPVAMKDIDSAVPSIFRSEITITEVQSLVADIVVAALNAVDAYRAAHPAPPAAHPAPPAPSPTNKS